MVGGLTVFGSPDSPLVNKWSIVVGFRMGTNWTNLPVRKSDKGSKNKEDLKCN